MLPVQQSSFFLCIGANATCSTMLIVLCIGATATCSTVLIVLCIGATATCSTILIVFVFWFYWYLFSNAHCFCVLVLLLPVQQCSLFLCFGSAATCSAMLIVFVFWFCCYLFSNAHCCGVLVPPVQQSWLLIFFIRNLMPELDSLAKKSRQLTSAYTLPVCTPSRAALLTGVYPFRWTQRRFDHEIMYDVCIFMRVRGKLKE